MKNKIPAKVVYSLFGVAAVCATYPAWRFWVTGVPLSIEQLLLVRCF